MKKKISSLFCCVASLAMLISAVMFVSCGNKKVYSGDKNRTFNVDSVEFEMVYVEGGTFKMGQCDMSRLDDVESISDLSRLMSRGRKVTLRDYYIGETEVTQALWQAVMGGNPSRYRGANRPVECVSWIDCQNFIAKLNELTGENFCLPTVAQWEFAARGGIYSEGYIYSGSNDIEAVAWYEDNACDVQDKGTRPVATKQPNELGIYDMSGNVEEWCQYSDEDDVINPLVPSSAPKCPFRGGSWYNAAINCRYTVGSYVINSKLKTGGLRLALK